MAGLSRAGGGGVFTGPGTQDSPCGAHIRTEPVREAAELGVAPNTEKEKQTERREKRKREGEETEREGRVPKSPLRSAPGWLPLATRPHSRNPAAPKGAVTVLGIQPVRRSPTSHLSVSQSRSESGSSCYTICLWEQGFCVEMSD
ncbi:hypothetical protein chiPu_0026117 [Chiloscyllium punctatum]|uniref:Uncharacterized protein n=1 Tax=Chiloscyllium punctatum TaxID=137246 RepID=A0A401THN8_CHIPU|nr:hypothetical protein [Chiloscyllium punctatum]